MPRFYPLNAGEVHVLEVTTSTATEALFVSETRSNSISEPAVVQLLLCHFFVNRMFMAIAVYLQNANLVINLSSQARPQFDRKTGIKGYPFFSQDRHISRLQCRESLASKLGRSPPLLYELLHIRSGHRNQSSALGTPGRDRACRNASA